MISLEEAANRGEFKAALLGAVEQSRQEAHQSLAETPEEPERFKVVQESASH